MPVLCNTPSAFSSRHAFSLLSLVRAFLHRPFFGRLFFGRHFFGRPLPSIDYPSRLSPCLPFHLLSLLSYIRAPSSLPLMLFFPSLSSHPSTSSPFFSSLPSISYKRSLAKLTTESSCLPAELAVVPGSTAIGSHLLRFAPPLSGRFSHLLTRLHLLQQHFSNLLHLGPLLFTYLLTLPSYHIYLSC